MIFGNGGITDTYGPAVRKNLILHLRGDSSYENWRKIESNEIAAGANDYIRKFFFLGMILLTKKKYFLFKNPVEQNFDTLLASWRSGKLNINQ